MKPNTIYLAGQITPDPRTREWRTAVAAELRDIPNLTIIDPCSSEFNRSSLNTSQDKHGYSATMSAEQGLYLLPHKDLDHVSKSTIVIFNLEQFDTSRPLIGTIFEMAWAFDRPNIMTIGIVRDWEESQLSRHPFVRRTIQAQAKDYLEAALLVRRFID